MLKVKRMRLLLVLAALAASSILIWWLTVPSLQCSVTLVDDMIPVTEGVPVKFAITNIGEIPLKYNILDVQLQSDGEWSPIIRKRGAGPVRPVLKVDETVEFEVVPPSHGHAFRVPVDYYEAKLTGARRAWAVVATNFHLNVVRIRYGKGLLWQRLRFTNNPSFFIRTSYSPSVAVTEVSVAR